MYIPPGFNTVAPYFFVHEAEEFVAFLVNGLGGTQTCRTMRPNGTVQNVQVKIGDATLMVSECTQQYLAMCSAFYLCVDNAVVAMVRAITHGASLEMAVADMRYGDRQGAVRDRHGHIWWTSQRIDEAPYTL
jgi:PhnB protein